jgi:hypothetical protein
MRAAVRALLWPEVPKADQFPTANDLRRETNLLVCSSEHPRKWSPQTWLARVTSGASSLMSGPDVVSDGGEGCCAADLSAF